MISLQNILNSEGQEFLDNLLNKQVIVNEKLNAATLSFQKKVTSETDLNRKLTFYKGSGNNKREITIADKVMTTFYKNGMNHNNIISHIEEAMPSNDMSDKKQEHGMVQYDSNEDMQLATASMQVFDSMVTRDYLHDLCVCPVKPFPSDTTYSRVRWYKVNRIVTENDVYFIDKLSMLYMSLHNCAKNLILVLNKQNNGDVELYLGARDFSGNGNVSGEILEAGLQGYFPGISAKATSVPEMTFSMPAVSCVSAIASLRDDKKEKFVQGLERLINATEYIPQFRAFFIADSVGNVEANEMITSFSRLYSSLSPAETLQMTFNESETK